MCMCMHNAMCMHMHISPLSNILIPPAGYIGKYTAHYDYTEEEVRRILIAAAILVSAAALEVGGALASGRVTHKVAYDHEDHDVPDVIKEEREREKRERERRGGERGGVDKDEEDGGNGGPGGRGGRPHPLEKKFLRMLVVVLRQSLMVLTYLVAVRTSTHRRM